MLRWLRALRIPFESYSTWHLCGFEQFAWRRVAFNQQSIQIKQRSKIKLSFSQEAIYHTRILINQVSIIINQTTSSSQATLAHHLNISSPARNAIQSYRTVRRRKRQAQRASGAESVRRRRHQAQKASGAESVRRRKDSLSVPCNSCKRTAQVNVHCCSTMTLRWIRNRFSITTIISQTISANKHQSTKNNYSLRRGIASVPAAAVFTRATTRTAERSICAGIKSAGANRTFSDQGKY